MGTIFTFSVSFEYANEGDLARLAGISENRAKEITRYFVAFLAHVNREEHNFIEWHIIRLCFLIAVSDVWFTSKNRYRSNEIIRGSGLKFVVIQGKMYQYSGRRLDRN